MISKDSPGASLHAALTALAVSLTGLAASAAPPTVSSPLPANEAIGVPLEAPLSVTATDSDSAEVSVKYYGRRVGSADPSDEFSVVALPDTQFYSENKGGDRAAIFSAQTDWIVAEKDARNIGFVLHLGDISQNGDRPDTAPAQWRNASDAMYRLENPTTTDRTEGIPYVMAVGNHDQTPIGDADGTTLGFNTWFGVHPETKINHFAGKTYYGGTSVSASADNNYCLFKAGGMDFIVISLEYDTTPDAADLKWADDLLKSHPAYRGIVITHHMVNTGNPATFSTLGAAIYETLKSNPNLILMHGGHVAGEGRRTDFYQGRAVHSILADYQGRVNGGDGWLRIMKFRPQLNRIDVETYSPTLDRFETDEDSRFTLDVNLKGGIGPFTEIERKNGAPGNFTGTWPKLEAGTRYEWYATVSDGITSVSTPIQSFVTGGVQFPPLVAISKPGNGTVLQSPAKVVLEATASDLDGKVSKVEFFNGTRLIGSADKPPYQVEWNGVATGSYTVIAKATDNDGLMGASLPVSVQVLTEPAAPDASTASAGLFNSGWTVVSSTASPRQFDTPGTNPGDLSLRINGTRVPFQSGIVAASNWENPGNSPAISEDNIVSPYQDSNGYAWVNNYDNTNLNAADANPECIEESAGTGVAFLAYSAGWVGASVKADGSLVSSNLPAGVSVAHADAGIYTIRGLATGGNLLAFPNGNTGTGPDNVVSVRAAAGIWTVEVRDNSADQQDGEFSFVYVPIATDSVVSGKVLADGTVTPLNVRSKSMGVKAVKNSDSLEITIGDGSVINPSNSVLFLTGDTTASLTAADNIHSWSADGNRFRIFSQDLPQLPGTFQSVDLRFLIVPLTPMLPTVGVEASDPEGGEFGADRRMAFSFHRAGSTAAALPVSFSLSGSATPGLDTTPMPVSMVIPAGRTSAELVLSVLDDPLAEGDENLTIQLSKTDRFTAGALSTATLVIHDRPLQAFLLSIQSSGAMADHDGDGQPDLVEYFMGSNASDPASVGGLRAERRSDGALVFHFTRARSASDVTGSVEWSTDLAKWFRTGESSGSTSASISTRVVPSLEGDREQLEAVLIFSPAAPAPFIFARLAVNL